MYAFDDLIKVATMYYIKRFPLKRIAKALGISVPTISRMLREAERIGLVKFEVSDFRKGNEHFATKLKERFDLSEVLVIKLSDTERTNLKEVLAFNSIKIVKHSLKPGAVVAIGPGETMASLVKLFPSDYTLEDITIIPLMGGWALEGVKYDNNKLVTELSSLLNCGYYLLPAPAYVSSNSIKNKLCAESLIKPVIDLWGSIDVAIFSVGPEVEHTKFKELVRDRDQIRRAKELNAVGDILGYLIDATGNLIDVPFNRRLISIPLTDLKKVPTRIVVAGGRLKYRAILAALKAGFATKLITDEITALHLLNEGGD
ncbi:sugar-binding transcriptional regulator [Pseudothermotoga sp.]